MLLCSILVIMAGTWAKEDSKQVGMVEMPSAVKSYLEDAGIKNYEVKKIPNPKKVSKSVKITCTEKEIDDYIATDLENYDSLKNTKKKIVKKGHFIRLKFSADKSMKNSRETVLKVGKNLFDAKMEKALAGKEKGKVYALQSIDNQKVYVRVEAIVKYVKQTLTRDFLKNTLGFASEEEYRAHVREELLEEKKQMQETEAMEEFYDEILSDSVVDLDSKEVADFCMNYYVKNEQQMAIANNENFEEYIREMYQLDKEEYYERNYREGEREIKEIVVVGTLASRIKCGKGDYQAVRKTVADHYVALNFSVGKKGQER